MPAKIQYRCQKCSFISSKWLGKCPECNIWNSFIKEEVIKNPKVSALRKGARAASFTAIADLKPILNKILPTTDSELNNVLGGGLVAGGVYLLSGDPGVGKSTLAMQISLQIGNSDRLNIKNIFYVSGEEGENQIGDRISRLKPTPTATSKLKLISETGIESIISTLNQNKADLIVFDSIQTFISLDVSSTAGSPSQIREVCSQLVDFAKQNQVPILIIGHITKTGDLAGPKLLEHLVDTVLFLEGKSDHSFRILRSLKNRFGSTNETGIFEMKDDGLHSVTNPSEFLLRERVTNAPGAIITTILEGNRPLLLEIQALTSQAGFGYPKRTISGFDPTRAQLIIGVLQKHAGLKLENEDIFINVVGGFQIKDRASDLAVALAIASSFLQKPLPANLAVFGELGLAGEIRAVTSPQRRMREAQKLGFTKILGPSGLGENKGIFELRNIAEAVGRLK